MHRLILFFFLLAVVSCDIKAVPYGQVLSAETLFSSSAPFSTPSSTVASIHYESPQHGEILQDTAIPETIDDIVNETTHQNYVKETRAERRFNMDDHFHNKNGDDWGLYVPIDLTSGITKVRRTAGFGLEKRGQNRGTVQMDCHQAPEVCKNAGWYQNCVHGAKLNYKNIEYENGPTQEEDPDASDINRFNSGVTTSWATPCKAWPFAQRFWHPIARLIGAPLSKEGLQTDEWPMASMKNEIFHPRVDTQVSLRCMTNGENGAGSRQVMNFRRCEGGNYDPLLGKWRNERNGACTDLPIGDTYYVQFNFDSFDPNDPADNRLRG